MVKLSYFSLRKLNLHLAIHLITQCKKKYARSLSIQAVHRMNPFPDLVPKDLNRKFGSIGRDVRPVYQKSMWLVDSYQILILINNF